MNATLNRRLQAFSRECTTATFPIGWIPQCDAPLRDPGFEIRRVLHFFDGALACVGHI
jgi:hypothetical protein